MLCCVSGQRRLVARSSVLIGTARHGHVRGGVLVLLASLAEPLRCPQDTTLQPRCTDLMPFRSRNAGRIGLPCCEEDPVTQTPKQLAVGGSSLEGADPDRVSSSALEAALYPSHAILSHSPAAYAPSRGAALASTSRRSYIRLRRFGGDDQRRQLTLWVERSTILRPPIVGRRSVAVDRSGGLRPFASATGHCACRPLAARSARFFTPHIRRLVLFWCKL